MADHEPTGEAGYGGGGRGPTEGEEELATRMLQVQSKRFYLDVKENARGRFLKMAEVGAGGRKSRLIMSMTAAAEVRDRLGEFGEFLEGLGPAGEPGAVGGAGGGGGEDGGQLKSAVVVKENRRYYLDLKENNRGRFLRVTQTVARGPLGPRSQVAVPAQGIPDLRDTLTELLDQFYQDDEEAGMELPEARALRAEGKMLYFDVGQNNRGVFMRISEVKNSFRSAVTIPEASWGEFREIFEALSREAAEAKAAKDAASPKAKAAASKSASPKGSPKGGSPKPASPKTLPEGTVAKTFSKDATDAVKAEEP